MPLKTEILKHLDELTPATQATKACNTIVRVKREDGSYKLVGTNTDVLGKSRSRPCLQRIGRPAHHTRRSFQVSRTPCCAPFANNTPNMLSLSSKSLLRERRLVSSSAGAPRRVQRCTL